MMAIIDITRGLIEAPLYPESMLPCLNKASDCAKGDLFNETIITASVHTATHADAFCHIMPCQLSVSIDQMALAYYLGPCDVLSVETKIDGNFLRKALPDSCRRILIKGDGKIYAESDIGEVLTDKGIITYGTDAVSVGSLDNEIAVHKSLLSRKIAILENLDLSKVTDGRYFLIALPIKLEGSDGAFVRAVLLEKIEDILQNDDGALL